MKIVTDRPIETETWTPEDVKLARVLYDRGYKWLGRNFDDTLIAYQMKPKRLKGHDWEPAHTDPFHIHVRTVMFKSVKNDDRYPTKIKTIFE